ncbi:calmodulin-binding protein 60 D-like [Eucalyptus grandis]|uniref:calmodulin-binding protein 60 D-like n=1 Tax=Eucalyptus grandis TaxID=71139 RepID=UPI00192EF9A4|nr:calmodulin-binding protein 60 D-like [Eucalyptus grandis]
MAVAMSLSNFSRNELFSSRFTMPKPPSLKEKSFQLHFMTNMSSHLFTEKKVQGDQGAAIRVALLNLETGDVVQSGPGSTAKLNVVVFDGDIEEVDWTREHLESHIISEGPDKRKPLLSVAKKNFPLLLSDYVWRLVGVVMGGQAHKQLTGARIIRIVGGGISGAMWKHTLEHATLCVSDDKQYVYYFDVGRSLGIHFNWNYELKGLVRNAQFSGVESLSRGQKVYLESLSEIAYQNYDQISECHSDMLDSNVIAKSV